VNELFADDLVWTHSSARVDSKASFLQALVSRATVYLTVARSEERIRVHGDLALVHGVADMRVIVNGQEREARTRYLCVWFRQEGKARMVAWQSTPAPIPAA
jgi:ketosteroid isomerase-like protein